MNEGKTGLKKVHPTAHLNTVQRTIFLCVLILITLSFTGIAAAASTPVLSTISSKTVAEGTALTFTVSATDPDGDTLTYSAVNLPSGSTFNTATRVFSWTPGYDQAGIYPDVQFRVSDGILDAAEIITITVTTAASPNSLIVGPLIPLITLPPTPPLPPGTPSPPNVNQAPVLSPIGNKAIDEGQPLEYTVSANDPDPRDELIYSAVNLPSGSTFNTATRIFSWTPGYDQAGIYPDVQFTVSDGSLTDDENITITVTNVNRPRVTVSDGSLDAAGDQSYFLGEEVRFSGTNSETDNVYLFITGPNLPSAGGNLLDPGVAVINGQTTSFTSAEVLGDGTWEYQWQTANLNIDAGSYMVYAVATPSDKDHLGDTGYATVLIIIRKPFVTATTSQTVVARGDNLFITGVAEGNPSPCIAIWILGKDKNLYTTESVNSDASFSHVVTMATTQSFASGQCFVVVQHPMNNNVFDVFPGAGTDAGYVDGSYPTNPSRLFKLEGEGALQGSDAAEALVTAIDNPAVDDTYTKLQFLIEEPIIRITPVTEKQVGDKFMVNGTTNLAIDDEILVVVISSSFEPTPQTQSGEFSGQTGIVKVVKGTGGFNKWSFAVDATTFKPDEYTIKASGITVDVSANTLFNVVPVNQAPDLSVIGSKTVAEDTSLTFTVSATDAESSTLTYSANNLPAGAAFNSETQKFTWTPGFDLSGTYPDIQFEVSDGSLTDDENITITVTNVNRAPDLSPIGSKTVTEGIALTFTVSATDPDGDTLAYSGVNLPSGATFDPTAKRCTWTPAYNQAGAYPDVQFRVSDGSLDTAENITISVNQAPLTASFTAVPGSGNAPLTVRFNDISTGNPAMWNWSFGDGNWTNITNINFRNTSHTYHVPGTYIAQLTVSNDGGSHATFPGTVITVAEALPVTNFSGNPGSGSAPLNVQFNDTSSGTGIITYQWIFSDFPGTIYTTRNSTHSFINPGSYHVNHSATNSAGTTWKNETNYITVTNPVPDIASISPISSSVGIPGFILEVNGVNFTSTSIVRWNGVNKTTTFVSGTQLNATITAGDIATQGTRQVTVFNPVPGGGTSSAVTFTINPVSTAPTITGIVPKYGLNTGTVAITDLKGTNFKAGVKVQLKKAGSRDIDATSVVVVSPTRITCSVNLNRAATGTWDVVVRNTDGQPATIPGGFSVYSTSQTALLTVNSIPAGGTVFIDGNPMGNTNLTLRIPFGTHPVKVTKTGYRDYNINVMLQGSTSKATVIAKMIRI